jgi:hypothetical protein
MLVWLERGASTRPACCHGWGSEQVILVLACMHGIAFQHKPWRHTEDYPAHPGLGDAEVQREAIHPEDIAQVDANGAQVNQQPAQI